jgi:hypothetical protein
VVRSDQDQGRGGHGIGICRPLPVHKDLKILSRLGVPKANSVDRTKNTVAELTNGERDKLKLSCCNFKYQLQLFERQDTALSTLKHFIHKISPSCSSCMPSEIAPEFCSVWKIQLEEIEAKDKPLLDIFGLICTVVVVTSYSYDCNSTDRPLLRLPAIDQCDQRQDYECLPHISERLIFIKKIQKLYMLSQMHVLCSINHHQKC